MLGSVAGRSMNVAVVGAGRMGAQIGCEYALGGHEVVLVARDHRAALERAEAGLALLREHRIARTAAVKAVRERLATTSNARSLEGCDLVVESLPDDLELKTEVLGPVAERNPEAIVRPTRRR